MGVAEDRLPVEDEEVSKAAQKAFEKRGIKFRVGAKVSKLTASKTGVSVALEVGAKAETLSAEAAIVAVVNQGDDADTTGALVGIAGAVMAMFFYIYPDVGASFALIAYVTVALGGFGSVFGAFAGDCRLGAGENVPAPVNNARN